MSYLKTSTVNVNKILNCLKNSFDFPLRTLWRFSKKGKEILEILLCITQYQACIVKKVGNLLLGSDDYEGLLLEILLDQIYLSYPSGSLAISQYTMMQTKKTNVDFLIPQESENITPVEMGRGKKNKYQIKYAISRHGCEYGIVVANNTNTIERKENVIYIPPMTFLFLYEVIMSGLESYYNDYLYML